MLYPPNFPNSSQVSQSLPQVLHHKLALIPLELVAQGVHQYSNQLLFTTNSETIQLLKLPNIFTHCNPAADTKVAKCPTPLTTLVLHSYCVVQLIWISGRTKRPKTIRNVPKSRLAIFTSFWTFSQPRMIEFLVFCIFSGTLRHKFRVPTRHTLKIFFLALSWKLTEKSAILGTLPVWIINFHFFSSVHIVTCAQKSGLALFECWKKCISLRLNGWLGGMGGEGSGWMKCNKAKLSFSWGFRLLDWAWQQLINNINIKCRKNRINGMNRINNVNKVNKIAKISKLEGGTKKWRHCRSKSAEMMPFGDPLKIFIFEVFF